MSRSFETSLSFRCEILCYVPFLSWLCYNVTKGPPIRQGDTVKTVDEDDVVWTYDNTQSTVPFKTTVTEDWTESQSSTLTITKHGKHRIFVRATLLWL